MDPNNQQKAFNAEVARLAAKREALRALQKSTPQNLKGSMKAFTQAVRAVNWLQK
jgi:hypothetical protein